MNENTALDSDNFISLADASKQTGYHQDYLGSLCRTGKLKGFKIGRNWVTTKKDIDQFLFSFKDGISELTDEAGQKIQVHVEAQTNSHEAEKTNLHEGAEADVAQATGMSEVADEPVRCQRDETLHHGGEAPIGKAPQVPLPPKPPVLKENVSEFFAESKVEKASEPEIQKPFIGHSLQNLKKEVFQSLENRVGKLHESVKEVEAKLSIVSERAKSASSATGDSEPVSYTPIAVPETEQLQPQRQTLHDKFASALPVAQIADEVAIARPEQKLSSTLDSRNIQKLLSSFKYTPTFSRATVAAATIIATVGFAGSVAWPYLSGNKQQESNDYTTRIVYQGSKAKFASSSTGDSEPANRAPMAVPETVGTVIVMKPVNQVLGFSDAYLYNIIDNRLNEYLAEGRFKGEKGDQGVPGVTTTVTQGGSSAPSGVASGPVYGGGTVGGFTYLSSNFFTTDNLTINTALTGNGSATLNGIINLNGTTTITNLMVGALNPGFTQGSVVFQGTTGLSEDNNSFFYDSILGALGLGTNAPTATLSIVGSGSTTPLQVSSSTGISLLTVAPSGNVGVNTSSPSANLTIGQINNGDTIILAQRNTDASPSGDFIRYQDASGNSLFRVDNAGNITASGIINNGAFAITSTSTPQLSVQYDGSSMWTASTSPAGNTAFTFSGPAPSASFVPQLDSVNAFSFQNASYSPVLSIDTLNRRVGINTSTPTATLSVSGIAGANPFVVSSSTGAQLLTVSQNGNVGIGTTTPSDTFHVASENNASVRLQGAGTSLGVDSRVLFQKSQGTLTNPTAVLNNDQLSRIISQGYDGSAFRTAAEIDVQVDGVPGASDMPGRIVFKTTLDGNAGATERMRLDNAGNLLIGTSTALATLSVQGSAGANPFVIASPSGSQLLTVLQNGNVGVGTASPGEKLHVSNGAFAIQDSANNNWISNAAYSAIYTSGSSGSAYPFTSYGNLIIQGRTSANRDIVFATASGSTTPAARMVISSSGNVGIGTTTPTALLTLQGAGISGGLDAGLDVRSTNASGLSLFRFTTSDGKTFDFGKNGPSNQNGSVFFYTKEAIPVIFANGDGSTGYSRIKIDSTGNVGIGGIMAPNNNSLASSVISVLTNGNVGIGTTTPAALLSLAQGTTAAYGISFGGDTNLYRGSSGYLKTDNVFGAPTVNTINIKDLAGNKWALALGASDLAIGGSGSGSGQFANVIFNNSGNVGIGTTSPSQLLTVGNNNQFTVASTGSVTLFTDATTTNSSVPILQLGTTAVNGISANGTYIGLNAPSSFSGDILRLQVAGVSQLRVTSGGALVTGGSITSGGQVIVASASSLQWGSASKITGGAVNGNIQLLNSAGTDFNLLQFGGTTSSFAALQSASGTTPSLKVIGADGSGNANLLVIGNVGIGTTSPAAKLDVWGNLNVATGSSPALYVNTATGQVGVNTSSLTDVLTIGGLNGNGLTLSGTNPQINFNDSTNSFRAGAFYRYGNPGNGWSFIDSKGGATRMFIGADVGGTILDVASSSGASVLRVASNGNVGIGTTSPAAKLDVAGGNILLGSNYGLQAYDSAGSVRNILQFTSADNVVIAGRPGVSDFNVFSSFIVKSTGSVGINGVVSPANKLVVNGGASIGSSSYNVAAPTNGLLVEGNVGIGTTSPTYNLHVSNSAPVIGLTASNGAGGFLDYNSQNPGIVTLGTLGAKPLYFSTANGNRMVIDTAGNVGVGTTTPTAKLTVVGSGLSSGRNLSLTNANGTEVFYVTDSGQVNLGPNGGSAWGVFQRNPVSGGILFTTNTALASTAAIFDAQTSDGTSRLSVLQNGNVGIGTTTPGQLLTVWGSGSFGTGVRSTDPSELEITAANPQLFFTRAATSNSSRIQFKTGNTYNFSMGLRANDSNFHIYDEAASKDRLVIDTNGNVGIGTTSPNTNLYVQGSSGSGVNVATFDITSAGVNSKVAIGANSSRASFGTITNTDIALGTNNSFTQLYLQAGGNVGIGTSSPNDKLDIYGGVRISDSSNSNNFGRFIWDNTGTAGLVLKTSNGGGLGSEALRVTAAGYVGIGTTTPTQKLDVNGNMALRGYSLYYGNSGLTLGGYVGTGNALFANGLTSATDLGVRAIGNLGLAANGTTTPMVTLATSGNVGIGTTSPSEALHVENGNIRIGNAGVSGLRLYRGSTAVGYINTSNTALTLQDNAGTGIQFMNSTATVNMIITNSGNVGIGTSNPTAALNVVGGQFLLDNSSNGNAAVVIQGAGNGLASLNFNQSTTTYGQMRISSSGNIEFRNPTSGVTYLTFDRAGGVGSNAYFTGSVGIGTTAPANLLDVVSGTGNASLRVVSSGVNIPSVKFANQGGTGVWQIGARYNDNNNLYFSTGDNVDGSTLAGAAKLTLQQNGNVGIGTTTPLANLHISANSQSLFVGDNTANTAYMSFNNRAWIGYSNNNGNVVIQGTSGKGIEFNVNNGVFGSGQAMTITSTGNVGIGTTTPGQKLNVWGNVNVGTSSTPTLFVNTANGRVGIGTSTPAATLHVNSNPEANGEYGVYVGPAKGNFDDYWGGIQSSANVFAVKNYINGIGLSGVSETDQQGYSPLGVWGQAESTHATGTVGSLTGVSGVGILRGSGTVDFIRGIEGQVVVEKGAAAATAGIFVWKPSLWDNGTIANNYGLYISDQTSGGITNNYQIYSAGANPFVVTSVGNVGIGTTTPGRTLTVAGDIRATGILYDSSNSAGTSGMILQTTASGYQWVATSTLGISGGSGVTASGTPGMLQFYGSSTNLNANANLLWDNTAFRFAIGTTSTSSTLTLQGQAGSANLLTIASSSGASLFTVNSSGQVGIGTTNVGSNALAVQGDMGVVGNVWINSSAVGSAAYIGLQNDDNTNSNSDAAFFIQNGGANGGNPYVDFSVAGVQDWSMGIDNADSRKFKISSDFGVASAPRLTITTGGNVGIGTTTPTQNLVVAGNAYVTGQLFDSMYSAGSSGMVLLSTGTGTQWVATSTLGISGGSGLTASGTPGMLQFYGSATNLNANANLFWDNTAFRFAIGTTSTSSTLTLQGQAGSANLLTIASSTGASLLTVTPAGNVGVGTTTPNQLLTVWGNLSVGTGSTPTMLVDAANQRVGIKGISSFADFYVNGSVRLTGSLAVGSLIQGLGTGSSLSFTNVDQFIFSNGAGGSTETMRLTTNNRVGIGTTTPAARLSVTGTSTLDAFDVSSTSGASLLRVTSAGSVGIGSSSPSDVLTVGSGNINIQSGALKLAGNNGLWQDAANFNTVVGISGFLNTVSQSGGGFNGKYDIAVGYTALNANTTGYRNTAIGAETLTANTIGAANTAIGAQALFSNVSSNNNTAVGFQALRNTTAGPNIGLGNQALFANTSGIHNTAVGASGALAQNVTGNYNTALGFQAGKQSLGSGNLYLGYQAGFDETGSNKLYIANASTTPLLYGDFSSGYLNINSTNTAITLTVKGTDASPANDLLDVASSSGSSYLRITSTGNVGIGTTTPGYMLTVAGQMYLGANSSADGIISVPNGNGLTIQNNQNASFRLLGFGNDIYFQNNLATGGMRFTTQGGGSYSGDTFFNTTGNVRVGSGAASNARLVVTGSTNDNAAATLNVTNASSTSLLYVRNDGNIGIGTVSPTSKLDIQGGTITSPTANVINANATYNVNTADTTGFRYNVVYNNSSISGAAYANQYSVLLTGTTSATTVYSFYSRPYMQSSGNINRIDSFATDPYIWTASATGAIGSINGIVAASGAYGGGATSNITTWRQIYVQNPTITAPVVAKYGIGIDNIIGGSSNNYSIYTNQTASSTAPLSSYALYNNGTAPSYFGGSVGIGITSPSEKLHVSNGAFAIQDSGNNSWISNAAYSAIYTSGSSGSAYPFTSYGNLIIQGRTNAYRDIVFATANGSTTPDARMVISSSGNVGIGTTSPAAKLDVWGNLQVGTSSTPTLFVNTGTGNVAVGMPTSASRLAIKSGGTSTDVFDFIRSANGSSLAKLSEGSTGNANLYMYDSGGNTAIALQSGSNVYFNTGGNVGIGTTSPAAKLHVASGNILLDNNQAIQFYNPSGVTSTVINYDNTGHLNIAAPTASDDIYLKTAGSINLRVAAGGSVYLGGTSAATAPKMFINGSSGNVGIGTTTPGANLEISGSGSYVGQIIRSGTSGSYMDIYGPNNNVHGTLSAGVINSYFGNISNHDFYIMTNNTDRLHVTNSGNVGIGSTSPVALLSLQGTGGATTDLLRIATSTGLSVMKISSSGDITIQSAVNSATAFVINNASGNSVLTVDTTAPAVTDNIFTVASSTGANLFTVNGLGWGYFSSQLGINSSTPAATLAVVGTSANPTLDVFRAASSSGSTYLTVTASGNVGIGTTSPSQALTVGNNNQFTVSNTGNVTLLGGFTASAAVAGGMLFNNTQAVATSFTFSGNSNGTKILAVGASGNALNRTDGSSVAIIDAGTGTTINPSSGSSAFTMFNAGATVNQTGSATGITRGLYVNPTLTSAYDFRAIETANNTGFSYYGAGTAKSYFGGDVGIGTATPGQKLDVWGNVSVGTSSTPTLFVNTANGRVGIGTSTPAAALHIVGGNLLLENNRAYQTKDNAGNARTFFLLDTNNDQFFGGSAPTMGSTRLSAGGVLNGIYLQATTGNVGFGTTSPTAMLHVGSAANGGNVRIANGWLCVDDNDTCTGATTAGTVYAVGTYTTGADVAENYPTLDATLSAGDIVSADSGAPVHVQRATSTASILGIVSTRPGILLNGYKAEQFGGASTVPVALSGRVPVKVTGENGAIRIGDYLTLSKTMPGYAAKAVYSTQVIGQALENFDPATTSTSSILTFVKVGYQNINNIFVLGENDGQLATATSTQSLAGGSERYGFLINQKGSGDLLNLQQGGVSRLLVSNNGSFNLFASTTIATSTILSVTNGTTTQFSITAAGHITVGRDTAGTATIKAGDNQAVVTFGVPYNSTPKVVVTMQGMPDFYYGVSTKTPDGFVIQTGQPVARDTDFDWVALAQPSSTPSQSSLNLTVISAPVQGQSIIVSSPPPAAPSSGTDSNTSATQADPGATVDSAAAQGPAADPASVSSTPVADPTTPPADPAVANP